MTNLAKLKARDMSYLIVIILKNSFDVCMTFMLDFLSLATEKPQFCLFLAQFLKLSFLLFEMERK